MYDDVPGGTTPANAVPSTADSTVCLSCASRVKDTPMGTVACTAAVSGPSHRTVARISVTVCACRAAA
ncbi:hypothetical protein DIPPA_04613 [Diplonema papillatum]|nr:hypothetical protein DIPPA_04613 [Diplonema papillatum]